LDHDVDEGGRQHVLGLKGVGDRRLGAAGARTGCPLETAPSRRHLTLLPIHLRAASVALARSSGLSFASSPSSSGSPLPAVLATMCHLRPSTLSIGTPWPLTSTRARRFCAIGLFWRAALRSSAMPAAWFFGVPVPLKSAMAYSTSASTLSASEAARKSRRDLSMSFGTPVPSL